MRFGILRSNVGVGLAILFAATTAWGQQVYQGSFDPSLVPITSNSGYYGSQDSVVSEVPANPAAANGGVAPGVETVLNDMGLDDKTAAAGAEGEKKEEKPSEPDLSMTAKWNNGLELSTKDKAFRVHVGGRSQFDVGWFALNENVNDNINIPYQNGVDFRRARFRIDGTMYETIEWAAEYDFVNAIRTRNSSGLGIADFDVTAITDLWWTFKEVPVVQNVRIGNQKEPIGFEHLVSSRFLPFMERSYNQDSFYGGNFNGFTPGIQIFGNREDEMGTWALGLFKPTDNVFGFAANNGEYAVTGRWTHLLWYCDDGADLLHIGASFRNFTPVSEFVRYRTRDAIRTGSASIWPIPADTAVLFGDNATWLNGELVRVAGPWTFQAEYLASVLTNGQAAAGAPASPVVGDLFYQGGYAQLLYFLTGEHDHYDRKKGFFERVIPNENYHVLRNSCDPLFGRGAWQIGARYNFLDLNNQGINGGQLHNGVVGLNWFLNPNMKIQFNYMLTKRQAPFVDDRGDGWVNGFGIRFAHDF